MEKPIGQNYFKVLAMEDAASVAQLERKLLPEGQWNGLGKIEKIIFLCEIYGCGLSFGFFNQSDLLGYHLSYPKGFVGSARSQYEKMVLFSDVAILPEHRFSANETVGKGLAESRRCFPGRPVQMFCFSYYKNKWEKRQDLFIQNGYRLARCDRFYSTRFQEHLFCLRWEPIGMPLHSADRRYRFRFSAIRVLNLHRMKRLIRTRMN